MIQIKKDEHGRYLIVTTPEILRVAATELDEFASTAWIIEDDDGLTVMIFRAPVES